MASFLRPPLVQDTPYPHCSGFYALGNLSKQGSLGSEIWFRDFRSLSRKGSGVPLDRVGLLGAFLSGSPGNGPDLVRVHANFVLCAPHSAMTRGAQ